MQPFGLVPVLQMSDCTPSESAAIFLHIAGERSALVPEGRQAMVAQWLFAALNSVEIETLPWVVMVAVYTERATQRPDFRRAHEDHVAHWRRADANRKEAGA